MRLGGRLLQAALVHLSTKAEHSENRQNPETHCTSITKGRPDSGPSANYNVAVVRAVIQRVSYGEVVIDDKPEARIGRGLLVLVAVGSADTSKDAAYLAGKTAGLRIFAGSDGRMTRSVGDVGGAVLAVPQFTLYGDVRRGLRPSFDGAAAPGTAESLYEEYVELLRSQGLDVATGVFQATMRVVSANEGPVTILLDSTKLL